MSAATEIPASSLSPTLDDAAPIDIGDPSSDTEPHRNRSFLVTWLLSFLLGFLGADRFYTGRYRTGALKLLSLGGLGIWWIIDLGLVLAGGLRFGRRPLRGFDRDKEVAWIFTGLTIIVGYSMQVDELISHLVGSLF
jgi:hypothetical protein